MTKTGKFIAIGNIFIAFTFLGLAIYILRSHTDLAGDIRKERGVLNAREQHKNDLADAVTKLQTQLDEETKRVASIESANGEQAKTLNTKIEELARELATTRGKLDDTRKQLDAVAAEQQERRNKVDQLKATLAALDATNAELALRKAALENDLTQASVDLAEVTTRNDDLVRRIRELESVPGR